MSRLSVVVHVVESKFVGSKVSSIAFNGKTEPSCHHGLYTKLWKYYCLLLLKSIGFLWRIQFVRRHFLINFLGGFKLCSCRNLEWRTTRGYLYDDYDGNDWWLPVVWHLVPKIWVFSSSLVQHQKTIILHYETVLRLPTMEHIVMMMMMMVFGGRGRQIKGPRRRRAGWPHIIWGPKLCCHIRRRTSSTHEASKVDLRPPKLDKGYVADTDIRNWSSLWSR